MPLPPVLLVLVLVLLTASASGRPQPDPCRLVQRTALCDNGRWTAVPNQLPVDVVELQLDSNSIQTLQHTSVGRYVSLRTLSLASNLLVTVASDTFRSSASLRNLVLSNNSLHRGYWETGQALRLLSGLRTLDLSDNQLDHEMVSHLLRRLTSLESLNLSRNLIQRLDESSFSDLHQLKELNLERNIMFEIDGAFDGNRNLQRLNLAFNYLPCLTDFHMIQLLVLNASHNSIEWFISRQDLQETFLLETLDLSHNKLLFFPSLPTRSRLRSLYLSDNLLRFYERFSDNAVLSVEFYNLKGNVTNVTAALWDDSLHGDVSSVETLDLRTNQLDYFPRGFIQKMPFLSRLRMYANCLQTLNLSAEKFPSSLLELDLSNNRLTALSADQATLSNLGNLTYVNLSRNRLETLPNGLLSSLPSIRSVDLSYSRISFCRSDAEVSGEGSSACLDLMNVSSLRHLHLRGCSLRRVPASALAGLRLTHLELSDNPELGVDQALRSVSGTLQHLGLGNTRTQTVDFSHFQRLKSLNISGNSLAHVPGSLLSLDLHELDLRDNRLTTIPPSQANVLASKLRTVYLTGNPFNCCQTEWFRTFEATQSVHMVAREDLECEDLLRSTHRLDHWQASVCVHRGGESVLWLVLLAASLCLSVLTVVGLSLLTLKPLTVQRSFRKKCFKPSSY